MTKLYTVIVALILIFTTLPAFTSTGNEPPDNNNLLWRISGNGLAEPSYVFGTIHLICEDDFVEYGLVEEKLAKTSQLVLELDLEDPMVMLSIMQHIFMDNDTILPQLISAEDYLLVEGFFKDSLEMDLQTVYQTKPFFLQTMVMPHMLNCATVSYDMYLLEKSKQLEIPVHGLETVEEQIEVFNVLPYRDQADMLVNALRNYSSEREEFKNMIEFYLAMDLEGMMELSAIVETEYEAFNFALIDERNIRWIPRMVALMTNAPTFFGVGAGHLPGHKGILNLLRQAGYIVEPLLN